MKVCKKRLFRLACLFAATVCWAVSLYGGGEIRDKGLSFGLRYEANSILPETLDTFRNGEESGGVRAALWNSVKNSEIQSCGSGRKAETEAVSVYGDMSLALHSSMKSGTPVLSFDEEGCILDEKSAYDLFGRTEAVGNSLFFEGKRYVVRGVLKGGAGVFYYPCLDTYKAYSNMEICFPYGDSRGEDILSFLGQNQFGTPGSFVDYAFLGGIMKMFYHLPAWIPTGILLWSVMEEVKKLRGKPILFFCGASVFLILALFFIYLTEFRFSVPQRFVPTKWSDFSFWSGRLSTLMQHAVDFLSAAPTRKDMALMRNMILCVCASIVSCTFFRWYWRNAEKERLSVSILLPLALSVFIWLLLAYKGFIFTAAYYYYLTLPVLALCCFLLRKWQAYKNNVMRKEREDGRH